MATKQKAVSTQLKEALAKIADLEKKLESEKTNLKYASEGRQTAERELNAVHDVLDSLAGAPKRRDEGSYTDRSAITRLAAYFATARG